MDVYVLGAGVSKSVGYPLGSELFDAIEEYVRGCGKCFDRFDHQQGWAELKVWLETNPNPMIVEAYRDKDIERLFTLLDLAVLSDRSGAVARDQQHYRGVLMWALEEYFAWRHSEDNGASKGKGWDALKAFAEKVNPGDVVITFNYDSTVERALLGRGKWSPRDGYGFELVFQRSPDDTTLVDLPKSPVVVLHLHGATGWYRRPLFAPDYSLPAGHGGALPWEAFGPAQTSTNISIDPSFLRDMGVAFVDACLPSRLVGSDERHVVLHPSFLKDYEHDESNTNAFTDLWRKAADALRTAERTYVVGYSLPKADSAALTLLLTNCREGSVRVVNPSGGTKVRLADLFRSPGGLDAALTFQQWAEAGCPESVPWQPKAKHTAQPSAV